MNAQKNRLHSPQPQAHSNFYLTFDPESDRSCPDSAETSGTKLQNHKSVNMMPFTNLSNMDLSKKSNSRQKTVKHPAQLCTWTAEEDKFLVSLARNSGESVDWVRISHYFEARNQYQCESRYMRLVHPELFEGARKMPWTEEEDRRILDLVLKYGPQKWSFIADNLPGRIAKQCRERWHNHLNPHIKKCAWSDEEEWILFLSHEVFGNRWSDIAKNIPGRTDNNIKNHWNGSMRKTLPKLVHRLVKIKELGGLKYLKGRVPLSALESQLLEKLLSSDEDYTIRLEGMKNGKPKSRSKNYDLSKFDKLELNNFNSFVNPNSVKVKVEEDPYLDHYPIPQFSTPISNNLKKRKAVYYEPQEESGIKLEYFDNSFNAPAESKSSELKVDTHHSQILYSVDSDSRQTHFTETHHSPTFAATKEIECTPKNNSIQRKSFMPKDFNFFQSPNTRIEFKNSSAKRYYDDINDENAISSSNFPKIEAYGGDIFFQSPFLTKKVKYNPAISPNLVDVDKTSSKLTDKTNTMHLNQQQPQTNSKDLAGFCMFGLSPSPINFRYDSPSKMMNFCTPERARESRREGVVPAILFNLNTDVEKSPSFLHKTSFNSFDKTPSLKF